MPDSNDSPSPPPVASSSFGAVVVASEAVLALLAWTAGAWSGLDWAAMTRPTVEGAVLGGLGGFTLVVVHLVLIVPGDPRNPLYRRIYAPLRHMLRPWARSAPLDSLLLVALTSGIAEELFFRGWLQTQTNIVVASLLFGAAHLWGREALPYGVYAAGMGFGLGALFAYTGQHLWAPALAHILNNLLGLLALRYDWLAARR